ncbi:TetR/AcrR family transcriptional regulator [Kitasatospora sp. NPDC094015]|uniref:TetR/AcrR family transcriptional regulator n=1 Tax=Kitasatospora sp. NPDC094015 TaxID=3155205 RepID=UPI0033312A62
MTAAGGDPRAERTRSGLRAALLAECAQRPLDQVSVSAVARRAGVGRATFYLHYQDLQALAVDACAEVAREAVEALHAWRGIPDPAAPPPAMVEFFARVGDRADLYRSLLLPAGAGPLGELLNRELRERSRAERTLVGAPHPDVVASAVAGAFTTLLADWLHDPDPAAPPVASGQAWRLLIALNRTPFD